MVEFRDRRPHAKPEPEDYERPLTRQALTEANRRFRQNGVPSVIYTDPDAAGKIVKRTIKERFNSRRKGFEDFDSVGAYLQYLSEQVT